MAMVMDDQQQQQQQTGGYKYYCKVCQKGFGFGRALGGHMRTHGMGEDGGSAPNGDNDDEFSGEWGEDRPSPTAGNKRMYSLRNNSNRLKTCRVCENCGKEFVSWKSFLEHGRCSSYDDEIGLAVTAPGSNVSSPRSDNVGGGAVDEDVVRGWLKGKRSRRSKAAFAPGTSGPAASAFNFPSSEEEDLANCLVMLSSARVDPMVVSASAEPEESCASASKDEDFRRPLSQPQQQQHHAMPVINFSPIMGSSRSKWKPPFQPAPEPTPAPRGLFECKACKKVFTSHQALGGHRASHKKVKGCFAAKLDGHDEPSPVEDEDNNNNNHHLRTNYDSNVVENVSSEGLAMAIVPFDSALPLAVMPLKKKSKVHECSICHRVFASGQALGGHKRRHWITSNANNDTSASTQQHLGKLNVVPPAHQHLHAHQLQLRPMFDNGEPTCSTLDLNLPAQVDEQSTSLQQDIAGNPLRLDIPASMYIQTLAEQSVNSINNTNKSNAAGLSKDNNNNKSKVNTDLSSDPTVEDEADSKVKLAKLSKLKDVNMGGGDSSPWLQVGIGSSANDHSSTDHHQP